MSALIRLGNGAAVRPFGGGMDFAAALPADPERDALRAEVARLGKLLETAEKDAAAAAADARAEGRREALANASDGAAERLGALERGIADALEHASAKLDALEQLAPALARAALAKLVDPPQSWSELVEAMLARQFAAARRIAVVAVHVSPKDFAGDVALDSLAGKLKAGELRIERDPALDAGMCRIEYRLGVLEIDARAQWAELAAVLEGLAGGWDG